MEKDRAQMLERLLTSYATWYDVSRCSASDAPLAATAEYHEVGTAYVLSRKAEMWSAARNEYVYFFSVPELTEALFRQLVEQAGALGEPRIVPHKEHMYSYIVAVILCESVEEGALRALKRYRRRKDFQFSLHGWMEIHATVIELGRGAILSNPDGRRTAKSLKNVLDPKPKRWSFGAKRKA
ncbi:MAG: hypothetical protein LUG25_02765 [Oscillospiraceae bacterium]|nr:hypothetical protein [Oscillospiraceae bacterium]